jgi:hypothetical protein
MDYLSQDGGKPKKVKSKTGSKKKVTKTQKSKSKTKKHKGGNFLGVIEDLVAPSGWQTFATAAALLAIDRADAAYRRNKTNKSDKKMKGGKLEKRAIDILSDTNDVNYWNTKEGKERAKFIGKQTEIKKIENKIKTIDKKL